MRLFLPPLTFLIIIMTKYWAKAPWEGHIYYASVIRVYYNREGMAAEAGATGHSAAEAGDSRSQCSRIGGGRSHCSRSRGRQVTLQQKLVIAGHTAAEAGAADHTQLQSGSRSRCSRSRSIRSRGSCSPEAERDER